jgi:hypothetical protein
MRMHEQRIIAIHPTPILWIDPPPQGEGEEKNEPLSIILDSLLSTLPLRGRVDPLGSGWDENHTLKVSMIKKYEKTRIRT